MKPESYPFLRIAKKYGVPYEDVLIKAQESRDFFHQPRSHPMVVFLDWPHGCIAEIIKHTEHFGEIQRGEIDWNTGEPT